VQRHKLKRKIKLLILTEQQDRDDSEKMELKTDGLIWKEDDSIVIEYAESRTTGFEGCTTTIKTAPDAVYVQRTGDYSSSLIIEENKEHYGHYITPMGNVDIGTRAYDIKNDLTELGGSLYLRYGLYVNGVFMNLTKMLVKAEVEN
jgi:uncharacterized beta-barrel protein YwiB (DUF1934 family)